MPAAISAARRGVRAAMSGAIVALCAAGTAFAQAEDDRMKLFRYYIVHVAIDVCEIDIDSAHQKRFDSATDVLERKIGLSTAEMDQGYKQIKTGAGQNPKGFCETYRPVAKQTLAEFD